MPLHFRPMPCKPRGRSLAISRACDHGVGTSTAPTLNQRKHENGKRKKMNSVDETITNTPTDAAYERETIIRMSDGDDLVTIWSAQRTVLTALRKKPEQFIEKSSGFDGSTEYAEFEIPKKKFNLAKAAKVTVNLTPEQREKRRQQGIANMAKMQASREKSVA